MLAVGSAADTGVQGIGKNKHCVYRPLSGQTASLVFADALGDELLPMDSPSVPTALSPSTQFDYLKLFVSKDRQANSLSTPHLTYKMKTELPLFFESRRL